MLTAYIIVTLLAAIMTGFSAYAAFTGAPWVRDNLMNYGVPGSWLVPLGVLKSAGATCLVIGIGVPVIGVIAALSLVGYFIGAVAIVARSGYFSHIAYPVTFMLPSVASLTLLLISHRMI